MDLATLTNAPRRFEAGGRVHYLRALSMAEWGDFQAWLKDHLPRPEAPEGSDAIDRAAYRDGWPPAIGSRHWFAALDHPGAFAALVRHALGRGPSGRPDDALALLWAAEVVDSGKVGDLVMLALGADPSDPMPPPAERAPGRLPESDEPGDNPFHLAKALGWSHADVMAMTFPQFRYYLSAGKPARPGTRRFSSLAAARAARERPQPPAEAAP